MKNPDSLKIRLFYHSVVSDWNNGNAHFVRGYARELVRRGHDVLALESANNWSLENLRAELGRDPVPGFQERFPDIPVRLYENNDWENDLEDADVVIVHEWNDPALLPSLKSWKDKVGFKLLFHDTHHRAISAPEEMSKFDLSLVDGILAFGEVLRRIYLERAGSTPVETWHEAADASLFFPWPSCEKTWDVVWIGNWGDEERSAEIVEFFVEPVKALGLKACVHGVRYPDKARDLLKAAGIEYHGWLPNQRVPEIFSRSRMTVHIPRRPYTQILDGIPTIRPFEAMACGVPLVSGPWKDTERLFVEGRDYLLARSGGEMKVLIQAVLGDSELADHLSDQGTQVIKDKHTCSHRVDQLLSFLQRLEDSNIR